MYSKKQEDFLEQRSRENLVDIYREELLKVIEGFDGTDIVEGISNCLVTGEFTDGVRFTGEDKIKVVNCEG